MSETPNDSFDPFAAAAASISSDPVSHLLHERALSPPIRPGLLGHLDQYEIIDLLGEGGMGVVLLARDPATSGRVAIKLLKPALTCETNLIHRFRTEATHMQGLSHPNILKILEVPERPGCPYVVLPYMQRGSLARLIREGGPLDTAMTLRTAMQIASALVFAHKKGIIHRDLKPANVLLGDSGEAHLADFGLGRTTVVNESTIDVRRQSVEGTPAYMAPEIVAGEAGDFRRDIYAFGALVYEMLTGQPPYTGATTDEVMQKVRAGPPDPILQRNPKASVALARIAEGAMARELRDRYAQMADVLADLERVEQGIEPLGPRHQPRTGSLGRVVKLGIGAAIACLGIGLLAFLFWSIKERERAAPHELKVDGSTVWVYRRDGRVAWTVHADGAITTAKLAALWPGKPRYLVVGVGEGRDAGKVLVYDPRGNLAWERQTAEPYPYQGAGLKQMTVIDLFADKLWPTGETDIVVLSNDLGWFPSKISVLDRTGVVKKTYWHPGQLQRVFPFKPSHSERLHVLAWGCNNSIGATRPDSKPGLYYHALVCLDPESMEGEAPPRLGNLGHGVEAWYALLLPQDARIHDLTPPPTGTEGSSGQQLQLSTLDGVFLVLNENGQLIDRRRGDVSTGRDVCIERIPGSPDRKNPREFLQDRSSDRVSPVK